MKYFQTDDFDELRSLDYSSNIQVALTEETINRLYEKVVNVYKLERPDFRPVDPGFYEQYYIKVSRDDRIQAGFG